MLILVVPRSVDPKLIMLVIGSRCQRTVFAKCRAIAQLGKSSSKRSSGSVFFRSTTVLSNLIKFFVQITIINAFKNLGFKPK